MSFEHEVYQRHKAGQLDAGLVEFFLPKGQIGNVEGPMWDYKVGFCHPNATIHEESLLLCELLHDIVALYNAFGGYLIIAYTDAQAAHFNKIVNKDDFDKLTDRYLKIYLPAAPFKIMTTLDGKQVNVLLLYVNKRESSPPVCYKRNSARRADGSYVFKSDDIALRHGSSTLIINQRHELLVFAFGERKSDIGEIPMFLSEADNNLPPRDPNLIEFIGRREYLITLWNWLADLRNPVKILTALGGTGKTAIAYEFCEQIIKSRCDTFAKVIWLTAKSQTYAAILQQYVSTTRTDFTNIDSFLNAFLREIGCLDSDFAEFEHLDDKLDFAKELIRDVPVLLVIDDLDSLDQDKQIELYSRIAQLFDQALSNKTQSRVLFTSRLEPNAGANRIIKIEGFSTQETAQYTDSLVRYLGGAKTWGNQALNWVDEIHTASKGSPIFIASILRLVSFGEDLKTVITNWRGKDGEEVRRFAFKREIDSLSYSDWRVLFVIQLLSTTTFEELTDLLAEDRQSLQRSLIKLSQFHMFSGDGNPATGAQLTVPEPIRLMVDITAGNLNAADAEELRKKCARIITRAVDGQSDVSRIIRAVTLLWKRRRYSEALIEAQRVVKLHPKSGELSAILGRTYLLQTPPDFGRADEAFKEAHQKKYDRPDLLEYWGIAKLKQGDIPGLLRITARHVAPNLSGVALLYRLAGLYRLARTREDQGDYASALIEYQRLVREVIRSLKEMRTDPVTANIRMLGTAVPNYIVECAYKSFAPGNTDRIFTLAVDLTRQGYPPLHYLEKVISDLVASSRRRLSRGISGVVTISKPAKLDGLNKIVQHLSTSLGSDHRLVRQAKRASSQV
jgi:tetratricopeptide (TPR) repeat protein